MPRRKPATDGAYPSLPASSYVVLGLVAQQGPLTPYDMKRCVADGVGYFWDFPHSQLYVEPPRLVELGLLEESRELDGRRRRLFSITEPGRAVLLDWVRETDAAATEIRDHGLLKLFFGRLATRDDVAELARGHVAAHGAKLAEYQRIDERMARSPELAHQRATLRMGLLFEQAAVAFWQEIVDAPPPHG
jgi:PadR family transcriptional regulator, regulatory protein AphA